MSESRWLTLSMIEGHIAMWAVRQSPYHCPDRLSHVLMDFRARVRPHFDDNEMAELSRKGLTDLLDQNLLCIFQVQKWNQRTNGRPGYAFVSRYNKPQPDDDFIDLDALRMNIVRSVFAELAT